MNNFIIIVMKFDIMKFDIMNLDPNNKYKKLIKKRDEKIINLQNEIDEIDIIIKKIENYIDDFFTIEKKQKIINNKLKKIKELTLLIKQLKNINFFSSKDLKLIK